MFRLFEITRDQRIEIQNKNGLYTVHELGLYQIEYYSIDPIKNYILFIEDEFIDDRYIKSVTKNIISTHPFRFFENYFGFAKVSINDENIQLNILGEKFELKEIEEIILYLFERNHLTLSKFVSKSSISGASVYEGKEYLYSSKYLNFVNSFCKTFEEQYINFKKLPHTVIRKKFRLASYNTQTIDSRSIEWLLQNLDSVSFDHTNYNHPDAIIISKNYGLIEKIGAEENTITFNTYENEIILGGFQYVEVKLLEIKGIVQSRLDKDRFEDSFENSQYTDFRDLRVVPFLRLLKEIDLVEKRLKKIHLKYSNLFLNTRSKNQYPKLTPIFYKYRHYQSAFNQIKLLRNLEYNLEGEIQLLNIRKLSELYEMYNLTILVEILDKIYDNNLYLKEIDLNDEDLVLSKVCFKNLQNNLNITLFYEPNINNNTKGLDLITIGNVKLVNNHCKPDFVIELAKGSRKKYCILDSKYSKADTVKNSHLTACIKKYILDLGIKGQPYQKPDYLILLHPDSSDKEQKLIYSENHFPQIQTIVSKPNYLETLEEVIMEFNSSEIN